MKTPSQIMKKTSMKLTLLVAGMALLSSSSVWAQPGSNDGNRTGGSDTTERVDTNDDNDTDYGWIGLLGLAGLAGLLKKPERQVVHHTDTVRTTPTGPGTGTGTGANR